MSYLEDQAHYNQRYRYSTLLKDYVRNQIDWGEFNVGFSETYRETKQLITSLRLNPEKFKTFLLTPKSKGFGFLITRIWWEVNEPETLEPMWENLNLDSEEIERLREKDLRECLEKISREMDAFLDS